TKTTVTITGGVDPSPVTLYLVRDASLRFTLAHAAEGLQYRLKEATNNGAVFFGGDFLGSTAMTDLSVGSDGAYHVRTVKSKHRTITLRASGYTEPDFSFIPVPGEEVDLGRLELKPGIRILGKVTD